MLNNISSIHRVAKNADGSDIVQIRYSGEMLYNHGMVFPITVSSVNPKSGSNASALTRSKTVMALLDTGCTVTSVDTRLAKELGLVAVGNARTHTATGVVETTNYVVDIAFPGNTLAPFLFHRVGSCILKYDPDTSHENPSALAVLIGRDLMSRWHMTWNGSLSAVFISD